MADSEVAVEDEENSAGTKEEDPQRSSQQEAPSSKEGNLGNRETQVVVTEQPTNQATDTKKVEGKEEEASLRETCSAFCQCLCSIGACVLFPCTSECCKCVEEPRDDSKIRYYLANGPGLLAEEIQERFSTSFSTYSTNMTTLLKEPIQDEDNRFFRIKASLTSIFVQEVYISTCLICTDKYKFLRLTSKTNF